VSQDQYQLEGPITNPDEKEGIVFFTWSEQVSGGTNLAGYGVISFYIIVVLGIGKVLRGVFESPAEQIFVKDMPKPDSLILICEGVLISRLENNLRKEEQLYFILIDIMRSPEILKRITDSSLKPKPTENEQN